MLERVLDEGCEHLGEPAWAREHERVRVLEHELPPGFRERGVPLLALLLKDLFEVHEFGAGPERFARATKQVVDDAKGVTLASVSTYKLTDGDKTAQAKQAGAQLAEAAKAAGVSKVVFDRGGNTYTGRLAAFADAAREAGLEF